MTDIDQNPFVMLEEKSLYIEIVREFFMGALKFESDLEGKVGRGLSRLGALDHQTSMCWKEPYAVKQ